MSKESRRFAGAETLEVFRAMHDGRGFPESPLKSIATATGTVAATSMGTMIARCRTGRSGKEDWAILRLLVISLTKLVMERLRECSLAGDYGGP
jgi:hypothetical protein